LKQEFMGRKLGLRKISGSKKEVVSAEKRNDPRLVRGAGFFMGSHQAAHEAVGKQ
jgi:hypothetical protein